MTTENATPIEALATGATLNLPGSRTEIGRAHV